MDTNRTNPELAGLSNSKPTIDDFAGTPGKTSHHSWIENCVKVSVVPGVGAMVVDTKNPDGPAQLYSEAEWHAFVLGVQGGEFNIA